MQVRFGGTAYKYGFESQEVEQWEGQIRSFAEFCGALYNTKTNLQLRGGRLRVLQGCTRKYTVV